MSKPVSASDDATTDEPLTTISGIGPARAEELASHGYHSVGDVFDAPPSELASCMVSGLGQQTRISFIGAGNSVGDYVAGLALTATEEPVAVGEGYFVDSDRVFMLRSPDVEVPFDAPEIQTYGGLVPLHRTESGPTDHTRLFSEDDGETLVLTEYLEVLDALGDVEVHHRGNYPAFVRFDGGFGMLAPRIV